MFLNPARKTPARGQPATRTDLSQSTAFTGAQIGGDDGNWWMITLSDLTLLLLGFFALWYAADKKKPPAVQPAVTATQAVEQKAAPVTPVLQNDFRSEEWKQLKDEMKDLIGETGLSQEATVELAQNEIILSLKDTLPFDSGKANLRPQALPVLEKVVGILSSHPALSLEISGHTDSVPIATAAFPSNWELSAARASRVARYLIEKGIDPARIAVQGYANQRPRVSNDDPGSREANRRVELRLYHSGADKPPPQNDAAP